MEKAKGEGQPGEEATELKDGAVPQPLPDGRTGVLFNGWIVETHKKSILSSLSLEQWEEKLGTRHMPEMVFGESSLILHHVGTGIKIYFNAFDALTGWKQERLPPVEVPAAAKWKFRSKPQQQVILDYDYTFTTPYCGSEAVEPRAEMVMGTKPEGSTGVLHWVDCDDHIDFAALSPKESIHFFDEVLLYEDELADNGVSLLTVKVRVMPSCWFLLLRFWLRVDGVLMRLRDTRMYCSFTNNHEKVPYVLRECCWRECTFKALSASGFPSDSASYSDPNLISQRLPVVVQKTQKLTLSS
ncbi:TIP41-like protein [Nymphaea thermarum]|nr:TIP41-like protein [Nymphaea thermarum]